MADLLLGVAVFLTASLLLALGVVLGRPALRRGCSLAPPGEDRACGGCESGCARRAAGEEAPR